MDDDAARWVMIDGRRWRASDPSIPPKLRQELVDELMAARRAVATANRSGCEEAVRLARRRVNDAKVALGERGAPWWQDVDDDDLRSRVESVIEVLTRHRAPERTICPSDAARVVGGIGWRRRMDLVRHVAADMADRELIEVMQRGKVVTGGDWRGASSSPQTRGFLTVRRSWSTRRFDGGVRGNDRAMQTFLPYPDFADSAQVLDLKRLGKQRVEAIQVVRGLTRAGYGWRHHPAVLMWQGYEEALGRYGLTITETWTDLGFADTCAATIRADLAEAAVRKIRSQADLAADGALPPWLGDEAFHRSHRSALVRKDPAFYRPLFPDVPDDLEYVWPGAPAPHCDVR